MLETARTSIRQRGLRRGKGADPEHDLTRIGLLRHFAKLGAGFNIVVDRLVKARAFRSRRAVPLTTNICLS